MCRTANSHLLLTAWAEVDTQVLGVALHRERAPLRDAPPELAPQTRAEAAERSGEEQRPCAGEIGGSRYSNTGANGPTACIERATAPMSSAEALTLPVSNASEFSNPCIKTVDNNHVCERMQTIRFALRNSTRGRWGQPEAYGHPALAPVWGAAEYGSAAQSG